MQGGEGVTPDTISDFVATASRRTAEAVGTTAAGTASLLKDAGAKVPLTGRSGASQTQSGQLSCLFGTGSDSVPQASTSHRWQLLSII